MPVEGWRIAAPKYANTTEEMLSGEGSFLYGGRWNSPGTRVVYLGTSIAQAGMELLVHLHRPDILNAYHMMSVKFPKTAITYIDIDDLPDDWKEPGMASSVQATGDEWVLNSTSLVLEAPSAAVLGGYNYLLNPNHADMDKVTTGPIEPFRFDKRLAN